MAIVGKPAAGSAGVHQVVISTTDSTGKRITDTLTLSVSANRPPVTTALPTQLREIGKPVFIQLPEFADIEGDNVTVSVKGLPAGLRFNRNTHQIQGTPIASAKGDFNIEVLVRDSRGNRVSERFTLSLLDKDTLAATQAAQATAHQLELQLSQPARDAIAPITLAATQADTVTAQPAADQWGQVH